MCMVTPHTIKMRFCHLILRLIAANRRGFGLALAQGRAMAGN